MEGLPFRLSIALILAAIILSIAFFELSTFTQFSERKQFADDVLSVLQSIRALSTGGDYGSFYRVSLRIPQGSSVLFDNVTNKIMVNFYGEVKQYNVTGTLLYNRLYGPAKYKLVIYYGVPSNATDPFLVAIK